MWNRLWSGVSLVVLYTERGVLNICNSRIKALSVNVKCGAKFSKTNAKNIYMCGAPENGRVVISKLRLYKSLHVFV